VALLRVVEYETIVADPLMLPKESPWIVGKALSLNIGPKGMLLLMDWGPSLDQVLRIAVPSASPSASIPTLADVRWNRMMPPMNDVANRLHFVGVRFLL